MKDLDAVFRLGVSRAVIGSAAVTDPGFVKRAVEAYGGRIAVGIDALEGEVKTARMGSGQRTKGFRVCPADGSHGG